VLHTFKRPAKHTGGPLYSQFFLEFKSILASAGGRIADFTRFVFPHLNLRSTAIEAQCIFNEAVFEEHLFLYENALTPEDRRRSSCTTTQRRPPEQGMSCEEPADVARVR
jgi:hypothetical protein